MGSYSKNYYPIMKNSKKHWAPAYPCRPKRECWAVKPPCRPIKPPCKPVKPPFKFPEYICKPIVPRKKADHGKKAFWGYSGGYTPADGWDQQSGWAPQDDGAAWGQDQQDGWAPQDGAAWGQDQQDGWAPQDGWDQQDDGAAWGQDQSAWYQQGDYAQDGWDQTSPWPWESDEQIGQGSAPAEEDSTLGAIRSAILDHLGQLGIQVEEADFLRDLHRLSKKELFALLALLGLLGFFVLLGFLSTDDLAVE